MAIYYTLGIDCGSDRSLADCLEDHFDGLTFAWSDVAPIVCRAHAELQRDIWFVCVYPRGMGHATLPESDRRSELAAEAAVAAVRHRLYVELAEFLGFRRAMFGAECFDQMAFATADEDSDIDFRHMISSVTAFPDPPTECVVEPFADGYRIVKAVRRPTKDQNRKL